MKCSKRSVAVLSLLSLVVSTGTLNARDADLGSLIFRGGSDRQTAMHKYLSCTISRLPSSEPVAIVRVSGCLPGLHPIHLYWFRTRMTDVPLAARRGSTMRLRPILIGLMRQRRASQAV